ncbi:MAG: hypothetical protein L0I85_05380, partial [Staphylococcus equorum]|nr:hypothetical protein [Staphylococcus equorum]
LSIVKFFFSVPKLRLGHKYMSQPQLLYGQWLTEVKMRLYQSLALHFVSCAGLGSYDEILLEKLDFVVPLFFNV